jgi:hypothetical protein
MNRGTDQVSAECQIFTQVTPNGVFLLNSQLSHSARCHIPAESIIPNQLSPSSRVHVAKHFIYGVKISRVISSFRVGVMRYSLFWAVTQRRLVVTYRRFGTSSVPSPRVNSTRGIILWPLEMGPIACLITSITHYHSTLCKSPEERRSREILVPHR